MSFNRTNHNHQYNNFSRQSHSRPAVAGWRSPQRPPPSHGQAPLLGASSRQPDSAQVHRSYPGPLRAADSIFKSSLVHLPPRSHSSSLTSSISSIFASTPAGGHTRCEFQFDFRPNFGALPFKWVSRARTSHPCKSTGFLGFDPGLDGLTNFPG